MNESNEPGSRQTSTRINWIDIIVVANCCQ